MENNNFVKISELDGKVFKVIKVFPPVYKMWDNTNRQMLKSETPKKGYRKTYLTKTDKGMMDVSERQIKDMLELYIRDGVSDINNREFKVKKFEGQNNIPIYYINFPSPEDIKQNEAKPEKASQPIIEDDEYDKPVDLSGIPF